MIIFLLLPDIGLKRARLKRWAWSPNAGLILFVLALLGGLMGAQIVAGIMGSEPVDLSQMDIRSTVFRMLGGYVGQVVILLLVPGFILGLIRARRNPVDMDRIPVSWWRGSISGIGGLILFYPMVLLVSTVVGLVVMWVIGRSLPEMGHATLVQLQAAAETADIWFVILLIMIAVATPVIEEIMYRGLLQEGIRRSLLTAGESPWMAIVITSILFAIMHGAVVDVRGLFALFVLSLGFGWVYLKTGRLLASIVMHAGFNVINLVQVLA